MAVDRNVTGDRPPRAATLVSRLVAIGWLVILAALIGASACDLLYAWSVLNTVPAAAATVVGAIGSAWLGETFLRESLRAAWRLAATNTRILTAVSLPLSAFLVWSLVVHWWTPPREYSRAEFHVIASYPGGVQKNASRAVSELDLAAHLPLSELLQDGPAPLDFSVSLEEDVASVGSLTLHWSSYPAFVVRSAEDDPTLLLSADGICLTAPNTSSCTPLRASAADHSAEGRSLLKPSMRTKV